MNNFCLGFKLIKILVSELNTLGNLLEEIWHHLIKVLLLELGQGLDVVDRLDTIASEGNGRREERGLCDARINIGTLSYVGLAIHTSENLCSEVSTGMGHRKSGGAIALLGLHDLITTELDAVDQLLQVII